MWDGVDEFVVYGDPVKHFGRITDRGITRFNLFTTTGRLSKRGKDMNDGDIPVWTYPALYSNTLYFAGTDVYGGDALDCEQNSDATDCIEKGDRVMLLNGEDSFQNDFAFPNIYTVEKISVNYEASRLELVLTWESMCKK